MSCAGVRSRLSAFIDRDLDPAATRLVAHHLAACAACAGELRALHEALRALQELPSAAPSGVVVAEVMNRIEVERRGPGLQLLFRSAWKARPLMLPSLVHGVLVFALALAGALSLDRRSQPADALTAAHRGQWEARLPASGTEANPLFPSSSVAVPQRRAGTPVPELLLEGEGSVFLETVVARDGSVSAVNLLDGDSAEGRALVEALRRERFEPTRVHGRPVAVSLYRLFSRMEVRARRT